MDQRRLPCRDKVAGSIGLRFLTLVVRLQWPQSGRKVYVLGGYADGFVDQPLNEEYDPATNTWRQRAPMPRGLNHVGAVGLNGKIYCEVDFLSRIEMPSATFRFMIRQLIFGRSAALPSPLGSVALAVLDGKIHAVGGRDKVSVGTHRVYDPMTDRWSELAPLREARDHMGLTSVKGQALRHRWEI